MKEIFAEDIGLVGRNKRVDTKKLQKALNIAKKHPITIHLPSGEFHIKKALKIYHNTTLILQEDTILKRIGKDALLKNGTKKRKYYGYRGNGNITISGGTFDMNGGNYPYNNTAMSIGHATDIKIENVTFKNIVGGHAIDACGLDGFYVENCHFLGFNDFKGDRSFSEAIQIDIQVPGAFPKFGAYDGTITQNVVIKDCYFGDSDDPRMKPWNRAIGSHASRYDQFYENIIIENNVFEGIQEFGLTPLKANHLIIQNNLFKNCVGGIRLLGVKDGVNAQDLNGIERGAQASKHIYIWHNQFNGPMKSDAIHIRSYEHAYFEDIVIYHNSFYENGNITFANTNDVYVIDNIGLTNIKRSGAYKDNVYIADCEM